MREFGVADRAVTRIGRIVHDLDLKDAKYQPAEAPTIGLMIDGLRGLHAKDDALLEHGIELFDALARSFAAADAPSTKSTAKPKRSTRRR